MSMLKRKFSKLFLVLGVIFLSMFSTGCSESNANSNQGSWENSSVEVPGEDQNYRLVRFDKYPKSISLNSWKLGKKTVSIVKDTEQLNEIFTSHIGEERSSYFSDDLVKENIVLLIMRYEEAKYDIAYSDFYVEGIDVHLSEFLLTNVASEVLSFYMDFVIIPKTNDLSDLNAKASEYNWIFHDDWK